MKRILFCAFAFLCCTGTLVCFTSCGGSGGSSSSGTGDKTVGLAPAKVTGLITLTPTDANVHGVLTLTETPAKTAYFNSTAGTTGAYTGNYTYTKVGPNLAEIKLENLRYEPINTANDCHWTIRAYITFIGDKKVIMSGTETLTSGTPGENDPIDFGGVDGADNGEKNHFNVNNNHDAGGTRNFTYNYTFEMEGN